MKTIFLTVLMLTFTSLARATTYNVNSTMSEATIQSTVTTACSSSGNTVSFAAGNYTGWTTSLNVPSSNGCILTGPTVSTTMPPVIPTAILNSDGNIGTTGTILSLTSCNSSASTPGQSVSIKFLTFNGTAGIYAPYSCNGFEIQDNEFTNNNPAVGSTYNPNILLDGSSSSVDSNWDISYNNFYNNCSTIDADGTEQGGYCASTFSNGSMSYGTWVNNTVNGQEEGLKEPPSGGYFAHMTVTGNKFINFHRIAIEIQYATSSSAQTTQNNVSYNYFGPPTMPCYYTFANSIPMWGASSPASTSYDNLVIAGAQTAGGCAPGGSNPEAHYGIAMEVWGSGLISQNNLIEGGPVTSSGYAAYSLGAGSGANVTNNIACGYDANQASAVGLDTSAGTPSGYTITPNSWPVSCPVTIMPTPTVSPASGSFSTPPTVTLANTRSNTTTYYTTDGSTPTVASKVYTGPFTAPALPATVKAITQWGTGANVGGTYPTGYGYTPSAVQSVTYTGATSPTVTLNDASTYTQHRIGINWGGQDYYDSFQLSNLASGSNPGMQPIQARQQITCEAGTTTTCTDYQQYDGITANEFAGGTYQVLVHGGQGNTSGNAAQTLTGGAGPSVYSVVPGTSGSVGCSGTITSNTAPSGSNGATFTLGTACAAAIAAHDQMLVVAPPTPTPNSSITWNTFGWDHNTTGSGAVTVDTTSGDLPPSPFNGVQVIKLDTSAASGSTAGVESYFDSGFNSYFLSGTYTGSVMYKVISGSGLTMTFSAARTSGSARGSGTVSLTSGSWATASTNFTITSPESSTSLPSMSTGNPINLNFTLSGQGTVLIIGPSIANTTDLSNGTKVLTSTINAVKYLNPGQCRYWGGQSADSLLNLISPEYTRFPTALTAGNQPSPQMGVDEFLHAAEAAGCESVSIVMPIMGTWNVDAQHWVDYINGGSGTTYGAIRIANGQTTGWPTVFKEIDLDYGNEVWNAGSFANAAMGGYSVGSNPYWNYMPLVVQYCGAMKQDSNWSSAMKCGSTMWPSNAGGTNYILPTADPNGYVDLAEDNQYGQQQNMTTSTGTDQWISAYTEAWQNAYDSNSASGFYQATKCGGASGCKPVSVYEYQNSTVSGSFTQAQINGYPEGEGYTVADVLMPLLTTRQLGVNNHNFFTLFQNQFGMSTTGGASSTHLWGIFQGPGGQYGNPRPSAEALSAVNSCIGSSDTGYSATGSNIPTYNFAGYNGVNAESNVPYVQFFAFKNGNSRCLVAMNLDTANSYTFGVTGTNAPTGTVGQVLLTSANLTDSNEAANTAPVVKLADSSLSSPTSFTIPAHSIVTETWSLGGGLDDTLTGWSTCALPGCNPGGSGVPTSTGQTINNASPSLDGAAMELTQTGTSATNVLWPYKTSACDSCTNISDDFEAYPVSSTSNQALEFDEFIFDQTHNVEMMCGTQWNQVSGVWQIWNQGGQGCVGGTACWVNTTITTGPTYGAWNSVQQSCSRLIGDTTCSGTECMVYGPIVLNGTSYPVSMKEPVGPLPSGWTSATGFQFQLDSTAASTQTEYVDEANVATSTTAPPTYQSSYLGTAGGSNTISQGGTAQFTAYLVYSDGSTTQLTTVGVPDQYGNSITAWTSSNTAAATVNSSGLVTGVAAGNSNIRATLNAGASSYWTEYVTGTTTPAPLMIGPNINLGPGIVIN